MPGLTVFHEGTWKPVEILGYGGPDGVLAGAEVMNVPVDRVVFREGPTMTVVGEGFSPRVTGDTLIVWKDADTDAVLAYGGAPTINYGGGASDVHRITLTAKDLDAIQVVNFGFDSGQDAGTFNIGSTYNYPTQHVKSITNLNLLTGLVYFCCNNPGFVGPIDFSNMKKLRHIECFTANVTTVTLDGCSSLVRLCLEQSALDYLDLNPVTGTLRDLRAASQSGSKGYLEFATISSRMEVLYHYCVRDQPVVNHIPFSKMPRIEQRWDWNTAHNGEMTNFEAPGTTNLSLGDWQTYGNPYTSQQLDDILVGMDVNLPASQRGRLIITGSQHIPSAVGLAAENSLVQKGWDIQEDWPN